MPKSYTDQEKEYIINRLKEEAAKCIAQYGIRKTTVDEIVKRVKIPKGTFYLFYQSKELLLFEVIVEQHEAMEREMQKTLIDIDWISPSIEKLTDVFCGFYKMVDQNPILKILNSDEVELLARKLPEDVVEKHLSHDNSMVEDIFSALPNKKIDSESLSAAFKAIFFFTLHREEVGEENFDNGLRLLVKGLLLQIF